MHENRPDHFLRLIRRSQRGRLKIYLGYAAGVGKTYQMLLEGHRIMADGIDLVVGLVETHGREETEALLAGLPVIPRRKVTYRGIDIEEMDIDALLSRRPAVVLVDELAHTNVPGSKNPKRYQDVEELLGAGIHVVSTLNIQHLESLYETVERATAVRVRERIPDRMLAEADEIVNVDITIEDLRRRLKEGKVYSTERIETALEHFFRPTNLEQLRELTLRELAAQIDAKSRDPGGEDLPSSPDQVMVCLSSRGPNSEALLRYASRLAGRLNRNWYALYVQTSRERPTVIDANTQRMLSNTLTLAQQLGATVFTYKGEDIVQTVLQFAGEYRVGHIVVGTPGKKVPFWKRLRGEVSLVERLSTEGKGLTLVVLDTRAIGEGRPPPDRTAEEPPFQDGPMKRGTRKRGPVLSRMTACVWKRPLGKEEAMRELLGSLRGLGSKVRNTAWEALLDRERQGGTFVGEDVAIPHARIEGLPRPFLGIGVGASGIADREAGRTLRIMMLLLSPAQSPDRHVELLGVVSGMARDDQWKKDILAAGDPRKVLGTIKTWEMTRRLMGKGPPET